MMDAATPFTDETAVYEIDAGPFAAARGHMVDSQVRPNKVSDPRILLAMRTLPRETFLPPEMSAVAYADAPVRLARGRAMMQPMAIARLVQLAAPRVGDRALVAAAGSGYGAALMAACGAATLALEEDEDLVALARAALPSHAPQVALAVGPIAQGWAQGGPYDIILLEGAVREIPPALALQLRPGRGRLVTVLTGNGRSGMAVLAESTHSGLRARPMFDCASPPIPSLLPPPGFVF